MQTIYNEVKSYLEVRFKNVRQTDKGIRFNTEQLNKSDFVYLEDVPCTNEILIKRSGAGLVVIIE